MPEPVTPTPSSIFRNRLAVGVVLLLAIIALGSSGYYYLGQDYFGPGHWSWEDVVYFTLVTISTVGFAETLPGFALVPYVRLWTIGLIFAGSGTLLYVVSTLTAFIIEGDLQGAIRRNRMQNRIDRLEGHFIICGVGSTGLHVIEELLSTGHAFVAIDNDEARLSSLADKYGPQRFLYVAGDATQDECLRKAGIGLARGIVAALTEDKDNLYITITARQLEPERVARGHLRVVSKAVETHAMPKLKAAGAHQVVSPTQIGGQRLVSELIRPKVVEFLDIMLRDERTLRLEEVEVPPTSPLVGLPLKDTTIRQDTNALVVAVRHPGEDGRYEFKPGPDLVLQGGMNLIVLVEASKLQSLRRGITSGEIGRVELPPPLSSA